MIKCQKVQKNAKKIRDEKKNSTIQYRAGVSRRDRQTKSSCAAARSSTSSPSSSPEIWTPAPAPPTPYEAVVAPGLTAERVYAAYACSTLVCPVVSRPRSRT